MSGVEVDKNTVCRLLGHHDDAESELPDFCRLNRANWNFHGALRSWWLPESPLNKKARTPVWDFISTCSISGREGLLLVEAKAHEGELDWAGKRLEADASQQSQINHDHIRDAVMMMSHRLSRVSREKAALSINSHYQLVNRVAWSAFLANRGIPVALLYIAFTGDTGVPRFIRDEGHWQRLMGA